MKKKGNKIITCLLILILFTGLSLLLYPTVSDYWNSLHQSQAIASYAENVAAIDADKYEQLWREAKEYNDSLRNRTNVYLLNEEQKKQYDDLLNVSENGVIGYIEIPEIGCALPIYHGTEESVLQVAIGHLEWTSLPTGGASTHCVVSGHRGLPSAKLFSELDKLVVGDIFMLRVLDEVMTYEVDQILIVEPDQVEALHIQENEDLCTLVTCTPYGINSHRLLVRGHRIENPAESKVIHVTSEAIQIDPMVVAPIVAIPIFFIFLVAILLPKSGQKYGEYQ